MVMLVCFYQQNLSQWKANQYIPGKTQSCVSPRCISEAEFLHEPSRSGQMIWKYRCMLCFFSSHCAISHFYIICFSFLVTAARVSKVPQLSGTCQSVVSWWENYSANNKTLQQFIAVFIFPTKSFLCISLNVQICFFSFRELCLVCWCNVTVTALIDGEEITCPMYLAWGKVCVCDVFLSLNFDFFRTKI